MPIIIRTDNRWKPFTYGADVPLRVLDKEFDWLDAAES